MSDPAPSLCIYYNAKSQKNTCRCPSVCSMGCKKKTKEGFTICMVNGASRRPAGYDHA